MAPSALSACVVHDDITEWAEHAVHGFAYKQLVTEQRCLVQAPDGWCILRPSTGAPPGSSVGTQIFNRSYAMYVKQLERTARQSLLEVRNPITRRFADLSKTVFVADPAATIALRIVGRMHAATQPTDQAYTS